MKPDVPRVSTADAAHIGASRGEQPLEGTKERTLSTIARITGTAIAAVLALGALAACSSDITPEPVATTPVATQAPEPAETTEPAPVETTPAEPEVVADEYSIVIDGVLYQGTEKAPVLIGEDTPGLAPAIDAQVPDTTTVAGGWAEQGAQVVEAGKYLVRVTVHMNQANVLDGYNWAVIAENDYGNIKVLESGPAVATIDEAAAGPFTLDGRTLDRAEYVVIVLT